MQYHLAELMLYNTCNFNCAYCSFVTSGTVKNIADLAPFRDKAYIDRVFDFFEANSTPTQKWILHLSGGEPLLMPNSDYFSRKFIAAGHKIGFNTNLTVPIESNGWADANPPEAVDAMLVSLHQEAVDQLDTIHKRVAWLRKEGYPVAVRMVGQPQFFPMFDDLEQRFKDIDVTFGVNPMYSPNYPAKYDDAERKTLLNHMKVHYEAVRLDGGLDVSDRTCNAGRKIICVALGNSGGGDVFPCSNTANLKNRLGNIFDDDVKLFSAPTKCLRDDQCCSCTLHFVHGVINGVDDTPTQQEMLSGYVPNIRPTLDKWLKTMKINSKRHYAHPQGTDVGETKLVLNLPHTRPNADGAKKTGSALKWQKDWSPPPLSDWIVEHSNLQHGSASIDSIDVRTNLLTNETVATSPEFTIAPGSTRIAYRVKLKQGAINVVAIDDNGAIAAQQVHHLSGNGVLEFSWRRPKWRKYRIKISAETPYGGSTQMKFSDCRADTEFSLAHFFG